MSWQIQYRRTNGPTNGRVSSNPGGIEYAHDVQGELEQISSEERLDGQKTILKKKDSRQKRGIEIRKDDVDNHSGNIDMLRVGEHIIAASEDITAENYEMFPERDRDRYRLRAKLTIMKDDVQTVLPIAKVTIRDIL